MHRKLALIVTGLMFLGAALPAQDTKQKDKAPKKAVEKEKKGTLYTVVSVDEKGKSIKVEDADGKASTLNISEKTEIRGPRNGKTEGLKDDRLVKGAKIRVVMSGKEVSEIYLPVRSSSGEKKDKKDKKKSEEKKPEDKKAKKDEKKAEEKKPEEKKPEDKKTKKEKAKEKVDDAKDKVKKKDVADKDK